MFVELLGTDRRPADGGASRSPAAATRGTTWRCFATTVTTRSDSTSCVFAATTPPIETLDVFRARGALPRRASTRWWSTRATARSTRRGGAEYAASVGAALRPGGTAGRADVPDGQARPARDRRTASRSTRSRTVLGAGLELTGLPGDAGDVVRRGAGGARAAGAVPQALIPIEYRGGEKAANLLQTPRPFVTKWRRLPRLGTTPAARPSTVPSRIRTGYVVSVPECRAQRPVLQVEAPLMPWAHHVAVLQRALVQRSARVEAHVLDRADTRSVAPGTARWARGRRSSNAPPDAGPQIVQERQTGLYAATGGNCRIDGSHAPPRVDPASSRWPGRRRRRGPSLKKSPRSDLEPRLPVEPAVQLGGRGTQLGRKDAGSASRGTDLSAVARIRLPRPRRTDRGGKKKRGGAQEEGSGAVGGGAQAARGAAQGPRGAPDRRSTGRELPRLQVRRPAAQAKQADVQRSSSEARVGQQARGPHQAAQEARASRSKKFKKQLDEARGRVRQVQGAARQGHHRSSRARAYKKKYGKLPEVRDRVPRSLSMATVHEELSKQPSARCSRSACSRRGSSTSWLLERLAGAGRRAQRTPSAPEPIAALVQAAWRTRTGSTACAARACSDGSRTTRRAVAAFKSRRWRRRRTRSSWPS